MADIKYLIPKEERAPVCLCLDSSYEFATDLEWHFFSEYMHGATVTVCDFRNSGDIVEVKKVVSRLKDETAFTIFSILRVYASEDMTKDIVIQSSWLSDDEILCRAIELILIDADFSYSIAKQDFQKEFLEENLKFLEIKISKKILKNKIISYDIDGVRQSKIATTLASIVTAIGVAITSE